MDYQGRRKWRNETDKWERIDGRVYYHHDVTREKMRKK